MSETQTTDRDLLVALATAVAVERREDFARLGLAWPPGDDGPYLPMDERIALVALRVVRAARRLT